MLRAIADYIRGMGMFRDYLSGAAHILDMGGTIRLQEPVSDNEAIRSDWASVGSDMQTVVTMSREHFEAGDRLMAKMVREQRGE